MKLFAVVQNGDFVRGRGKSPHIRTYSSKARAEAYARRHVMGESQVVEFVPKNVNLREPAINWTWEELENHLEIFDIFDVSFFDGGEHVPFGGDSGVSVLRVTDVSPQKNANDKVILHISTDNNWFGKGRWQILSDKTIQKKIDEALKSNKNLRPSDRKALKKAFGIGVKPQGPPTISTIQGQ